MSTSHHPIREPESLVKLDERQQPLPAGSTQWYKALEKTIRDGEKTALPSITRHRETIGAETKMIEHEFLAGKDPQFSLDILHITDVQFGHAFCKYERVVEYRDWILSKPNRYMTWGGDMIDAATALSVASPYENITDPHNQYTRFCELWAPAAHRVLGYVGGNHEARTRKVHIDMGLMIARTLGIPYSMGKQIVKVKFAKHDPFIILLWHGGGSAQTAGSIANVLERHMLEGNAQLYLMGHLHRSVLLARWRSQFEGNQIKLIKTVGASGTSFLERWGTYSEVKGFQDHDVLMPLVELDPNGKWEVRLR